MLKPMLLTQADEIPKGEDWLYETKYDGFRCMIEWIENPVLVSRNGKILNPQFPEIIDFLVEIKDRIRSFLPLQLDSELVFLTNNFQSNFSVVQTRSRMSSQNSINKHAMEFPCHLVVFDLLQLEGESQTSYKLTERKDKLQRLCKAARLPTSINNEDINRIQIIDVFNDNNELWNKLVINNGEGVIA